MAQTGTLGKTPVILVILLTVATCGAYVPIWYIQTRSTLAGLKTSTKPAKYLPYGLLSLYVVAIGAGVTEGSSLLPTKTSADNLISALSVIYFCIHALVADRVVDILHEYSYEGLTLRRNVAWLRAIIFSAPYLQYEMNRLPSPVDGLCPPPESA